MKKNLSFLLIMNVLIFFSIIQKLVHCEISASENKEQLEIEKHSPVGPSSNTLITDISLTCLELLKFPFILEDKELNKLEKEKKSLLTSEKLREGITAKIQGCFEKAEESFLCAAKNGHWGAMNQLALLAKQQGKIEECFYWYILSSQTGFLKDGSVSVLSLNGLKELQTDFPSTSQNKILNILEGFRTLPKISESKSLEEKSYILFKQFINIENFALYSPILENQLLSLTHLAQRGEAWVDLSQKYFDNKIGLHLNRKDRFTKGLDIIKKADYGTYLFHLGSAILEGLVTMDEKGIQVISEESKIETAARLYREANTPYALSNLGCLIENGKVNKDEKGKKIDKNQQYRVAARLYRRAKNIPDARINLAKLIAELKIDEDENNSTFPPNQRFEVAARLFRSSHSPLGLQSLARLLEEKKIKVDEKGTVLNSEKDQFDAAARLYTLAQLPESFYFLGSMIEHKKIAYDEKGTIIESDNQRYNSAAHLYRLSRTPDAIADLAILIDHKKINFDEEGVIITSDNQRYNAAARLYRYSSIPRTMNNLALLLLENKIDTDEKGGEISSDLHRIQSVRLLLKQSNLPQSLNNLGALIWRNQINIDEKENLISTEKHRYEAATYYFLKSNSPDSLYNLGIIRLTEASLSLQNKREIMDLFFESMCRGFKQAARFYVLLKKSIDEEDNLLLKDTLKKDSSPQKDLPKKQIRNVELKDDKKTNPPIEKPSTSTVVSNMIEDKLAKNEEKGVTDVKPSSYLPQIEHKGKIEEPLPATHANPLIHQTYKDLRKKEKALKIDKNETKRKFKLLTKGKLSKEETYDLIKKDTLEEKDKFYIHFEPKAKKQFNLLDNYRVKKIMALIKDIRKGDTRTGKPELLKGKIKTESRRITEKDRLVYKLEGNNLTVISCEGHYDD